MGRDNKVLLRLINVTFHENMLIDTETLHAGRHDSAENIFFFCNLKLLKHQKRLKTFKYIKKQRISNYVCKYTHHGIPLIVHVVNVSRICALGTKAVAVALSHTRPASVDSL
jgi:hypothetical protein